MLPVVPRSVNSVACVKRIQHEIHVSWQAIQLFFCSPTTASVPTRNSVE